MAFSFYTVSVVVFISERAPQGQGTTTQALYLVALAGLTSLIAGPLSGVIFDTVGAYWLYVTASVGYVLGWLVLRVSATGRRSKVEVAN